MGSYRLRASLLAAGLGVDLFFRQAVPGLRGWRISYAEKGVEQTSASQYGTINSVGKVSVYLRAGAVQNTQR